MKFFISTIAAAAALLVSSALGSPVSSTTNTSAQTNNTTSMAELMSAKYNGPMNALDDNIAGCGVKNRYGAYYAAISEELYGKMDANGNSAMCNKCILIHGVKDVIVEVIGLCEGCDDNTLEVSDKAMEDVVNGQSTMSDDLEWQFVNCPGF
ncbi:hypothetical protein LPJ66_003613 [Kickxella alabastrina]|uniref:Uncharacterized protein n=1 Tax=Kickxella alabastrina TaxID=61397 RepID=A0ACC1IKB7_9FUNG|nr:hypothetical protein LPJ66_003613 [Kickxella alabastrina]